MAECSLMSAVNRNLLSQLRIPLIALLPSNSANPRAVTSPPKRPSGRLSLDSIRRPSMLSLASARVPDQCVSRLRLAAFRPRLRCKRLSVGFPERLKSIRTPFWRSHVHDSGRPSMPMRAQSPARNAALSSDSPEFCPQMFSSSKTAQKTEGSTSCVLKTSKQLVGPLGLEPRTRRL
jgi:hypothetical protein